MSGQSTQPSCTVTAFIPRWQATPVTCRVWFDWMPPIDTSVSQPWARASATRYSSFRTLFPPKAMPELQSSRLAQISTFPPMASLRRRSGCVGEGPKRRGMRGKSSRLILGPVAESVVIRVQSPDADPRPLIHGAPAGHRRRTPPPVSHHYRFRAEVSVMNSTISRADCLISSPKRKVRWLPSISTSLPSLRPAMILRA